MWVSLDKGKHKNQRGIKGLWVAEGEDQILTGHSASADVLVTMEVPLQFSTN